MKLRQSRQTNCHDDISLKTLLMGVVMYINPGSESEQTLADFHVTFDFNQMDW